MEGTNGPDTLYSHQAWKLQVQGPCTQIASQHLRAKTSRLHLEQLPPHQTSINQLQAISYWWLCFLQGRCNLHCLYQWWNLLRIIWQTIYWYHHGIAEPWPVYWRPRPPCWLCWHKHQETQEQCHWIIPALSHWFHHWWHGTQLQPK